MSAQPPVPLVTGIRQIALSSESPETLADFYTRALHLTRLFDAGGMVFLDAGGGIRLMIGPSAPGQTPGGDVVCYFEPVIWDVAERSVQAAGATFLHPAVPLQRAEGRELALRAFRDPEGHTMALLGWRVTA